MSVTWTRAVMLTTHITRDTCQTLVSYGHGSSHNKELLYLGLVSNGNVCFHDIFVVTIGKSIPQYIGETFIVHALLPVVSMVFHYY